MFSTEKIKASNKTPIIPWDNQKSIPLLFIIVVLLTIIVLYTSILLSESSVGDQLIPFFSLSIVLGLLGVSIAKGQSLRDSTFQVKLFVFSFGIRIILAIIFYEYFMLSYGEPFVSFGRDDFGYHTRAIELASSWASSGWHYPGYHAAGYDSLIALFYFLLGPVPLVVRLLNCFAGALAAVYTYRIGNFLFGKKSGRLAGYLVAFMPDFLFWSVVQYRDMILVILTLYLVWFFIVRFSLKISFIKLVKPLIIWIIFVLLHPRGALGVLAAIILYVGIVFSRQKGTFIFTIRKISTWTILIVLIIGSLWFVYELRTETLSQVVNIGERYEEVLFQKAEDKSLSNIFFRKSGGIEEIAINSLRFLFPLFIPIPHFTSQLDKIFVVLGSVIWYFLFPCTVYGIAHCIRKKRTETILLIIIPIILLMGIFFFFYSGSFRYKIQFMPLLLILSAFGMAYLKRWFIWYLLMLYALIFAFVVYFLVKL